MLSLFVAADDNIRIIQGAFVTTHDWPTRSTSSLQVNFEVAYVYSTPSNAEPTLTLITPEVSASKIDIGFPNQTFYVQHINVEGTSMTAKTKPITSNAYLTTLTFRHFKPEDYHFVIHARLENGTVIKKTNKFYLYKLPISPLTTASTVRLINETATSVVLRLYDWHSLRTLVFIFESSAMVQAKLTIQELIPVTGKCASRILLPSEAKEICGIQAFTATRYQGNLDVRIIIQARKPCVLSVDLEMSRVQKYFQNPIRSTVFISVIETDIIHPKEFWVSSGINNEKSLFVNDSVTLTCIVASCYYYGASWCFSAAGSRNLVQSLGNRTIQDDEPCFQVSQFGVIGNDYISLKEDYPYPKRFISSIKDLYTLRSIDPSVYVSSRPYQSWTLVESLEPGSNKHLIFNKSIINTAFDITFTSLQLNHTNTYKCQVDYLNVAALFYISVESPLEPRFLVGSHNATDERTLKKNGVLSLSCLVQ